MEGDELFVVPVQPESMAANSRDTESNGRRKGKDLNFSICVRAESAVLMRWIGWNELCAYVSSGTTVRKYKNSRGTAEQGGRGL